MVLEKLTESMKNAQIPEASRVTQVSTGTVRSWPPTVKVISLKSFMLVHVQALCPDDVE